MGGEGPATDLNNTDATVYVQYCDQNTANKPSGGDGIVINLAYSGVLQIFADGWYNAVYMRIFWGHWHPWKQIF